MGLSSGDAALLQAAKDRPEEHNSVSDGTRGSIEEQLMAYLTVRPMSHPSRLQAHARLQANSDHLSSYLTSQRVSNMCVCLLLAAAAAAACVNCVIQARCVVTSAHHPSSLEQWTAESG